MTPQPLTTPAPDPLLDANVFWYRHRRPIIAAFLAGMLALVGIAGYWLYQQRHDSAAADALANAKTSAELQKMIAQFSGTPAGATAYLLLAEQQRNESKFAEANASLQTFLDKNPKHELASTARMAMGANQESLGKSDEALVTYKRVSGGDSHGFNAPLALLAQAHLLKEKKQLDEARQTYETIMTQYRDSIVAGEATRQLRMLKPGKNPAPSPAPATSVAAPTGIQPVASVAASSTPANPAPKP